jgi:hypothetical protein
MKKDTNPVSRIRWGNSTLTLFYLFSSKEGKETLEKNSTQHPITSLALMQTEKSGEA